ncbi:hypothetical protein JTB14_006007 [Gonioctena quinquepunctata]|nr:hypothetical protein JTB14_006007 [Gonioctena quinquepunctata]
MSDLRQCTRQFLREFIELYKTFPCLWQVKSAEYSDRNKKSQAYEILIEKYREIDEAANKETVQKKINSLRTVYKKERAKIIQSTKSGAGEDDIYKPSLWYFSLLEFLSDQDQIRKSTNTIDDETYEESEKEYNSEDQNFPATPSPGPSASTPISDTTSSRTTHLGTLNRKKKVSSNNNETAEVMTKISKRLDSFQEDSHDRYGKHVADRLRAVHPDQVKFAMKLISDVLYEADLLSLDRHSKIVAGECQQNPNQLQPVPTQQYISQHSRTQYIPDFGLRGQIPRQGCEQGYYLLPGMSQQPYAPQLQIPNQTTTADHATTHVIPSTSQQYSNSMSLPATSSISNISPTRQVSQQLSKEDKYSLLEIDQQQYLSQQLSAARKILLPNDDPESTPSNVHEYLSNFNPN